MKSAGPAMGKALRDCYHWAHDGLGRRELHYERLTRGMCWIYGCSNDAVPSSTSEPQSARMTLGTDTTTVLDI